MKELHEKEVDKEEFDKHLMDESEVDPVQMLIEDHNHVKGNFESFEQSSDEGKEALLKDTLLALVVHTKLEEEFIYPMMKKVDKDLIGEAEEEHHVADFLITELKSLTVGDEKLDSKFKVLGEIVKHHIKEEEEELFPKLRKLDVNFEELASNMIERKRELKDKYNDLETIEPVKTDAFKNSTSSRSKKESPKKSSAGKSRAKASPKKVSAKKSPGNSAKKSTAKKSTARAVSRKADAKKSTTRAATKKSTAKKTTTKKGTPTAKKPARTARR